MQGNTQDTAKTGSTSSRGQQDTTFGAEGNALLESLMGSLGLKKQGQGSSYGNYNGLRDVRKGNEGGSFGSLVGGQMDGLTGMLPGGQLLGLPGKMINKGADKLAGTIEDAAGLGDGASGNTSGIRDGNMQQYVSQANSEEDASQQRRQAALDALSGTGPTVDKEALLNAIRNKSDTQTQQDIALGRSKFYNRPTGRNDINLSDTVARNAAARDAALASTGSDIDKFNAQQLQQRQIQAAQNALQGDTYTKKKELENQQILQALSILAGKSIAGDTDTAERELTSGAKFNLFGGVCWVAREVYGVNNPAWLSFRAWLYTSAPTWLFNLYLNNGEHFAFWLKDKPKAKKVVKFFMDFVQ